MSYANGTPFLNLAQTIGTDHRDWFDENAAKLDLDTKMKTLWDGAADTAEILSTLQENVGELQTDVTTLEGVVSGHTSTITTINESLVLINTALNALNTQVTNKFDSAGIADPYDATHGIYAVGDVVTYNGQRYVCSTAVTAAEPFDVSKWTAEDVQTVIDSMNTILTALNTENTRVWTDFNNTHQVYLRIIDNIAIVTIVSLPVTVTAGSYTTILDPNTLPKPAYDIYFDCANGSDLTEGLIGVVNTDGSLKVSAGTSGGKSVVGTITYPIA